MTPKPRERSIIAELREIVWLTKPDIDVIAGNVTDQPAARVIAARLVQDAAWGETGRIRARATSAVFDRLHGKPAQVVHIDEPAFARSPADLLAEFRRAAVIAGQEQSPQ